MQPKENDPVPIDLNQLNDLNRLKQKHSSIIGPNMFACPVCLDAGHFCIVKLPMRGLTAHYANKIILKCPCPEPDGCDWEYPCWGTKTLEEDLISEVEGPDGIVTTEVLKEAGETIASADHLMWIPMNFSRAWHLLTSLPVKRRPGKADWRDYMKKNTEGAKFG